MAWEDSQDRPAVPFASMNWPDLVARIHRKDESGMEELYFLLAQSTRHYILRQLGTQELDDKIHDVFLIVVQAIRRGRLRESERLMGFVRTVAHRQVNAHFGEIASRRRTTLDVGDGSRIADRARNPEQTLGHGEDMDFVLAVLGSLAGRDRDILERFYLEQQSRRQICQEMNLTVNQFRLLKSRAKQHFAITGRRKLQRRAFPPPVLSSRMIPSAAFLASKNRYI